MTNSMEEELQKLGLNEHEAKVYLVALSLGPASAAQLSDSTNMKRPTVYLTLDNLMKQGIVSEIYIDKKRLFAAEKPDKLAKLTKRMRRKVIDAELMLESILPELLKYPKQYNEEPKVVFYSGIEGVKNVIFEISSCNSSWYFFGSSTKILQKLFKLNAREIIGEAEKLREDPKRPKVYFITDAGVLSLKGEWEKIKTPWREMKILPQTINASSGFVIYEDKVAIISFDNKPFAAVIKSRETVEVMKVMYQLIWKSLG